MRVLDRVNLNHMKIFESVCRLRSMTAAAKELNLTQSGISQHIKTLEDNLGIKLFDRYRQKIVPTSTANILFEKTHKGLGELEVTLRQITGTSKELFGIVKVGFPLNFGTIRILPHLNKLLAKHPKVKAHCQLGLTDQMCNLVLEGELDFAYVDGFSVHRKLFAEKLCSDMHEMVASNKYLTTKTKVINKKSFYESLDYIAYMSGEPILKMWFEHHLKATEKVDFPQIETKSIVNNPQAVLQMIQANLGVGVLPQSMLDQLPKDKMNRLKIIKGTGKPMGSPVSCISLPSRPQSPAGDIFMQKLNEALREGS